MVVVNTNKLPPRTTILVSAPNLRKLLTTACPILCAGDFITYVTTVLSFLYIISLSTFTATPTISTLSTNISVIYRFSGGKRIQPPFSLYILFIYHSQLATKLVIISERVRWSFFLQSSFHLPLNPLCSLFAIFIINIASYSRPGMT